MYVPCEICKGARYNRETLEVRFHGMTIADVLNMPCEEALEFFSAQPPIARHMQTLVDVGLDIFDRAASYDTVWRRSATPNSLASQEETYWPHDLYSG